MKLNPIIIVWLDASNGQDLIERQSIVYYIKESETKGIKYILTAQDYYNEDYKEFLSIPTSCILKIIQLKEDNENIQKT